MRFTTQGETLYAIALGMPDDGELRIESLGANSALRREPIEQVRLLASNAEVEWTRGDDGLRVRLPAGLPDSPALVLKIE